jgi:hypothetical protein
MLIRGRIKEDGNQFAPDTCHENELPFALILLTIDTVYAGIRYNSTFVLSRNCISSNFRPCFLQLVSK